jgi:hypothetical protein
LDNHRKFKKKTEQENGSRNYINMEAFGTRLKRTAVFSLLVLGGAAGMLQAQQPTGEIRLQVKDPSGAVVTASVTSPICLMDVTGSK